MTRIPRARRSKRNRSRPKIPADGLSISRSVPRWPYVASRRSLIARIDGPDERDLGTGDDGERNVLSLEGILDVLSAPGQLVDVDIRESPTADVESRPSWRFRSRPPRGPSRPSHRCRRGRHRSRAGCACGCRRSRAGGGFFPLRQDPAPLSVQSVLTIRAITAPADGATSAGRRPRSSRHGGCASIAARTRRVPVSRSPDCAAPKPAQNSSS